MEDTKPAAPEPADTLPCSNCREPMPRERAELLGVTTCIKCTKQKKKPLGVWDYPEGFHERNEGVGGLIVLDND
jgi:hypothetical protein